MEDKRGTKLARSLSKEGSPSPSGAPTPPSAPSGSPSPLGSPPEVSSRYPRSPEFEQGGSSGKAPVVDLSSSSDEEGNVIILSDSDEEEEVREEDAANAEAAPSSAAGIPASTASVVATNEDFKGMQNDNSDDLAPDQEIGDGRSGGDNGGSP
jgi:hypothetical protein